MVHRRNPMKNTYGVTGSIALFFFVLSALAYADTGVKSTVAETIISPDAVIWNPLIETNGITLTVSGVEGAYFTKSFPEGENPYFELMDDNKVPFPDGLCNYELVAVPVLSEEEKELMQQVRELEETGGTTVLSTDVDFREAHRQSGVFTILNGEIVTAGTSYTQASSVQESPAQSFSFTETPRKEIAPLLPETGAGETLTDQDTLGYTIKDIQHLDDVIITFSLCVGNDCVNGENFGFDTLRLKENNTRIKFDDTSNSASFPKNDWQLTANDSENGGANKFSIDDITNGRTPFTIEAGAPSHSLFVEDSGQIGLGTSNPVTDIHVVSGNTPTLRLEQDGSSGFTAQTWDVAGNEANFFVRDVTNSSKLPFKIKPGAPTSSIFIAADGSIGFGKENPSLPMHLLTASSTDPAFALEKSGSTMLLMAARSTDGYIGTFGTTSVPMKISAGGAARLTVFPDNSLSMNSGASCTTGGVWTDASSRTLKENIREVSAEEAMKTLSEILPVKYNYKADSSEEYVGFIAEDVPDLVATKDRKSLAPMDIVAVLTKVVQEQQKTIDELSIALAAIEENRQNQ